MNWFVNLTLLKKNPHHQLHNVRQCPYMGVF